MPERPPLTLPEHVADLGRRMRKVETRKVQLGPAVVFPAFQGGSDFEFDCVVDHALTESDPVAHVYLSFADALANEAGSGHSLRIYLRSQTPTVNETVVLPTAAGGLRNFYVRGRREVTMLTPDPTTELQLKKLRFEGGNSVLGATVDLDGVAVDSFEVVATTFIRACRMTFCLAYGSVSTSTISLLGTGTVELLSCVFLDGLVGGAGSALVKMSGCWIQNGAGTWRASGEGTIVSDNRLGSGITIINSDSTQNHVSITGNTSAGDMALNAQGCVVCEIIGNGAHGTLTIVVGMNAMSAGGGAWTHTAGCVIDGNSGASLSIGAGSSNSFGNPFNCSIVCTNNVDGIGDIATNSAGSSTIGLSGGWGIVTGNRIRGSGAGNIFNCNFSYMLTFSDNQIENGPVTPTSNPGAPLYMVRIGVTAAVGNVELRCRAIIRDNILRWYNQTPGGVFGANYFGFHIRAQVAVLRLRDNIIEGGTTHTDASTDGAPDIANNRLLATVV